MKFRTKEELFRDIPAQGNSVTSKNYSHTTDSFARWYYEEGLSDGAERSAKGLDPYSDHFSESCKSKFPNALREAIDRYLDRKGPLVNFPEPEVLSILVGDDMINFNIFQSKYVKCLAEELDKTLGLIWEYRNKHWGAHRREKRRVVQSMGLLLFMMLALVFDLPVLLIGKPVQALYQLVMPLLSWKETSVAHVLIPGLIEVVLCGVAGGFLVWKTLSGIPKSRKRRFTSDWDNKTYTAVTVTALVWPFILLMPMSAGFSFLEAVQPAYDPSIQSAFSKVVDALTSIGAKGHLLTVCFLLVYAVALLDQAGYYLHLLWHQKGILAGEARQVAEDAKMQWSWYEHYFNKLESTDRQLKFLEIWNQALGGKAQFSRLFDIDQYVKKGENAILPDNIPLLQQWTLRQEESLVQERKSEKKRKEQMEKFQKREALVEKSEDTFKAASGQERKEALSRFPLCFDKDGGLNDSQEAFALLRTALGYSKLAPAEPYPSNAPGALAYRDGFQCECGGHYYVVAKEHYETAAKLGHLLALARLANIYDTDRKLDSVIAYGDALSVEQWSHPMEHEAEEARRIMGLTPQAAISCLLRHAWHPQAGFDLEVLYYLAQRCIGDRNVDEEITSSVCLFASALLTPAAEKNDARCAYYLARLNLDYYKNRRNSCLWAEISAGLGYGPAMYFLYSHQKDFVLNGETARMYCYQAWEKKYPPARICEVWDKLNEKRHKEMERAINQAKENALREARERQKNAQLEAYKKQLEARERVLNLTLRDAYLDDDAAHIAGLMSTDELMIGKILKENELEKYKKELDKE